MKDESIKDKKYRKARCRSQPEIILPSPSTLSELPPDYPKFLLEVKRLVSTSRTRTLVAATAEMTLMYWQIGKMIIDRQDAQKWGAKVIDRLSHDLKESFPGMAGFSPRNLKYMRKFAESWPDSAIVQRTVALIPWRSNLSLMDKLENPTARLWYAQETIKNGWSKEWLDICIESHLMERQGSEPSNFKKTLSLSKAEKVQQIFKDPYLFDFLGIDKEVRERELENALISHVEKFLLELGQGFAFVGRQVHVEFEGDDFYLDLLFYHLKLRCFVVVELKVGEFNPGDAAQLNFYQTVVNHTMKHPSDSPTIGLLLVKNKNDTLVRYCLEGMKNPIGVSGWATKIKNAMPKELRGALPTIEQIESELASDEVYSTTVPGKSGIHAKKRKGK